MTKKQKEALQKAVEVLEDLTNGVYGIERTHLIVLSEGIDDLLEQNPDTKTEPHKRAPRIAPYSGPTRVDD